MELSQDGTPYNAEGQPAQDTTAPGGEPTQTTGLAFQVPEKFAGKGLEDVIKSYTELESKYGEVSSLKNQLEQMGGLENLKQWAQAAPGYYQAYQQAVAQLQQAQQHAQTQQAPAGDPFENWEMLTPKEQAQRQTQLVAGALTQYINTYGQQAVAQMQEQQRQQLAALNTQWDIYRTVNDIARKNPSVDPNALLQSMAKIAGGDLSTLVDIATKQVAGPAEMEAKIQAELQRRLADERLKAQNSQLNTLTSAGRSSLTGPTNIPVSHDDATTALLKKLLQDGAVTPANF